MLACMCVHTQLLLMHSEKWMDAAKVFNTSADLEHICVCRVCEQVLNSGRTRYAQGREKKNYSISNAIVTSFKTEAAAYFEDKINGLPPTLTSDIGECFCSSNHYNILYLFFKPLNQYFIFGSRKSSPQVFWKRTVCIIELTNPVYHNFRALWSWDRQISYSLEIFIDVVLGSKFVERLVGNNPMNFVRLLPPNHLNSPKSKRSLVLRNSRSYLHEKRKEKKYYKNKNGKSAFS